MGGLHGAHSLGAVVAGHLGEGIDDNTERLGELREDVLVEAGRGLGAGEKLLLHLHLEGTAAGDEARVLGEGLVDVHAVVDGALDVVHVVLRAAADDNGGQTGVALLLGEDKDVAATQLRHVDGVARAEVLEGRGAHLGEDVGGDGGAQTAEVELGRDLDGHETVALDEVQGEVTEVRVANDDVGAGLGDVADDLVHDLLLLAAVAHKVLGVLDEHGALRLRRGHVDGAAEHCDLGLLHVANGALDAAGDHEAADHGAIERTAALELAHADIVHVEATGVVRARVAAGLGAELSEVLLVAGHLGTDGRADGREDVLRLEEVLDLADDELVHNLEGHLTGLAVAGVDIAGVETEAEQVLGAGEGLAGEDDDKVRAVTDFLFHGLRGHGEQVGGGVLDLQLVHDGGGVVRDEELTEVVDDELAEAVGAHGTASDLGELLAGGDVLEDGVLNVRGALLEHRGQTLVLEVGHYLLRFCFFR
eukprot:PhM_4_TR9035/c0_g1_i1/m.48851